MGTLQFPLLQVQRELSRLNSLRMCWITVSLDSDNVAIIGILYNHVKLAFYIGKTRSYNAGADYIQFMILELLPPFILEDVWVRDLAK